MSDRITVTLTGRPPVSIVEAEWPIIAMASRHDNQHEQQANRRWKLIVRQHADGRKLVYGYFTTQFTNERSLYAGQLLSPESDVIGSIEWVAEHVGPDDDTLADECIADLPAEQL